MQALKSSGSTRDHKVSHNIQMRMRIRTFRFLAGGATPAKTREIFLRFVVVSATTAVGGGSPDGFLWSPSTVLTYTWLSLCWLRNLLPRGGVAALWSVVLLRLSSGSISVRGEPHPLLS